MGVPKHVRKLLSDLNTGEMFGPKYFCLSNISHKAETLIESLDKCIRVLEILNKSIESQVLKDYLSMLTLEKNKLPELPVIQTKTIDYSDIPPETKKEYCDKFQIYKDSVVFRKILELHLMLTSYQTRLSEKNPEIFADFTFTPFGAYCPEFPRVFVEESLVSLRGLVFSALNNLDQIGRTIFNTMLIPDVDIHVIASTVQEVIKTLKHRMNNRCGDAFRFLEKRVAGISENFDVYYREYIITNNPTSAFDRFMSEIAENLPDEKGSVKILRQFVKITNELIKLLPPNMKSTVGPALTKFLDTIKESCTPENDHLAKELSTVTQELTQ